jgi:DNA repair protein RecN (Recombination protein N)
MISRLSVRHLAVVDDLEISFEDGMTSLTGETGAGKSLVVDALGLVLGDRADSKMVRHGCERAEISASFQLGNNPALKNWLVDQQLDEDDLCELRRTVTKDGRSRAFINGRSVSLSQLKAVSEHSIDIHGQHAHQSLLRPEVQKEIIDIVADNKPLLKELKAVYSQWQACGQKLNQLQQIRQEQAAHLELLQYQVSELEKFELTDETINDLLQEQAQLANASQFISNAESAVYQIFDQEPSNVYGTISHIISDLEHAQDIEPHFASAIESLNNTLIHLDEAGSELRHYTDHMELNPERLQEVESIVSDLHDLARKHHIEIERLPSLYQSLCEELASINHASENEEELIAKLNEYQNQCLALASNISERRLAACVPLATEITKSIQQLAMPAGEIKFNVIPDHEQRFNETGFDSVQLLVRTNPGQDFGGLAKVASGGELARISLAIQVATSTNKTVPTLVFDEVDVGIGGSVAEIVGTHLRSLAVKRQVICITHLPQVASQAHQQLQVSKKHGVDSTRIEIYKLTEKQRIEEIARMLGGVNLTEKTCLHAEEMLMQAQQN